ncbi:hypothetical protein ACFLZ8_03320, partial [Planctomycetota bacterium]
SDESRKNPSGRYGSLTDEQAKEEASRCLHCDCRKPQSCKLRKYAQSYEAQSTRYKTSGHNTSGKDRAFIQSSEHPDIVFEPGKCIDCGLCIQIVSRAGEKIGLTFTNRGFDVRVAVPFGRSLTEAIRDTNTAAKCVKACPTGALAFKISENDKIREK